MLTKEVRPFPLNSTVIIRSTLFALAQIGTQIQEYNESDGVIIATLGDKRWKLGPIQFGDIQHTITATVREYEQTALLELEVPDSIRGPLLDIISKYAVEGTKAVTEDAVKQWHELIEQLRKEEEVEEARRRREELISRVVNPVRKLLSRPQDALETAQQDKLSRTEEMQDNTSPQSASLATVTPESKTLTGILPIDTKALELKIPDSPGILITTPDGLFELKPDPAVFTDRTAFLQKCEADGAVCLRGSKFCPNCGRPLTLAVAFKHEIQAKLLVAANACIRYGLLGLAPSIIPLLLVIALLILAYWTPAGVLIKFANLLAKEAVLTALFFVALPFVALPSLLLGQKAISEGQKATQYLSFNFNFEHMGRGRVVFGQALGWLDVYLGLGLFASALIYLIWKGL
ncbi:MAG: hypothetical protein ACPL4I_12430 [Bacteroidota bacterium]